MKTWIIVLISVATLVVLFVVGSIAGGVYWWMHNKDALLARGSEIIQEGQKFGATTDNNGCVDESILRYKKDPGFSSAVSTGLFMRACLDKSKPTAGFCDKIPRENEFLKTVNWRLEQCKKVDLSADSRCGSIFQVVQNYCERK